MADWSTAAVAAISAGAALGATYLQGYSVRLNQARLDRRADRDRLIGKVEQLFVEIEDIEAQVHRRFTQLLLISLDGAEPEMTQSEINLGHVRACAKLYFPELLAGIEVFDKRHESAMAEFRALARDRGAKEAGLVLSAHMVAAYQGLFAALRQELGAVAGVAGAEVRSTRAGGGQASTGAPSNDYACPVHRVRAWARKHCRRHDAGASAADG